MKGKQEKQEKQILQINKALNPLNCQFLSSICYLIQCVIQGTESTEILIFTGGVKDSHVGHVDCNEETMNFSF